MEHFNFTEKDFDMLIEGLDHLPEKDLAATMVTDLLTITMSKDVNDVKRMLAEKRLKEQQRSGQKELLREEVTILKAKIIQLKRYLIDNKLMNDVQDTLKNT